MSLFMQAVDPPVYIEPGATLPETPTPDAPAAPASPQNGTNGEHPGAPAATDPAFAPAPVPDGSTGTSRRTPLMAKPDARVKVIVNPVSGKKGGITTNAAGVDEVRRVLEAQGIKADIYETQAFEDGTVLGMEALDEKYDLVVACGGDGTVDDVAAALMGSDGVMGIMPLGSANNVARMLHVPFDLEGAARLLKEGEVKCIDVGRIGHRAFLETAGVGMDAALFPLMTQVDEGAYLSLFEAARTFWNWRPHTMWLTLDGVRVRVRALMVLVANGPYWGYSVPLAPDAKVDDHRFDVIVFENISKWDFVRHILASLLGRGKARDPRTGQTINRRVYNPRLRYFRARTVEVRSRRRLPVHGDARPLGHTPVRIHIQPNALNVIVGQGEHVTVDGQ
jgi:YegS/Rv2252/BmrU family lipid kinase